ncbi:MAG: ArgE/DapE family deacylase [Chloroflexota bacterium]|nr:ArgE/DapE family deacylase [Chloroflexota bacterium]
MQVPQDSAESGTLHIDALWREAEGLREPMIDFTQRLIQTPSLPGQEGAIAQVVVAEMQELGYDEVRIDEAGNVIGRVCATAAEPGAATSSIMFNTHIDHVDVGDHANWPFPPYEGVVTNGEIWGRGASDLKGSLACHVYTGALLKRSGLPLPNDVYVVGVVQEELGGAGSAVLAENLQCDYVVIGEPSYNKIALGHRGRVEIVVTITGKSVHASVPNTGINPLYSMSRFLQAIEGVTFEPDPDNPDLGATSIAPTLITTDQTSKNVVPGQCTVILDVRNSPVDSEAQVLARVREVLQTSLQDGATGTADVPDLVLTTYTGVTRILRGHGAFGLSADSPLTRDVLRIVSAALRREVPTQMWKFATDAGYFINKGMEVIGFGPGYEHVIHTVEERISIDMMVEGMVACAALALELRGEQ